MTEILLTESRQFVADHCHSMPGSFESRHGHNWELEVTVRNYESFRLESTLDSLIEIIDYSSLSNHHFFEGRNATAEAVAELAFQYLETRGLKPLVVRVREKSNYWAACTRRIFT
jgi:6-pyruvoyl-tetrahydropterin synthase